MYQFLVYMVNLFYLFCYSKMVFSDKYGADDNKLDHSFAVIMHQFVNLIDLKKPSM